jgi:hypothetical protein
VDAHLEDQVAKAGFSLVKDFLPFKTVDMLFQFLSSELGGNVPVRAKVFCFRIVDHVLTIKHHQEEEHRTERKRKPIVEYSLVDQIQRRARGRDDRDDLDEEEEKQERLGRGKQRRDQSPARSPLSGEVPADAAELKSLDKRKVPEERRRRRRSRSLTPPRRSRSTKRRQRTASPPRPSRGNGASRPTRHSDSSSPTVLERDQDDNDVVFQLSLSMPQCACGNDELCTYKLDHGDFFNLHCGGRYDKKEYGCDTIITLAKTLRLFDDFKYGPIEDPVNANYWSIATTDLRKNKVRGPHYVRLYKCVAADGDCTARIRQIFPGGTIAEACVHSKLIEEMYLFQHNHPAATKTTAKIQLRINLETAFKNGQSALRASVEGSQNPEDARMMPSMDALRSMRRRVFAKFSMAPHSDAELVAFLATKAGKQYCSGLTTRLTFVFHQRRPWREELVSSGAASGSSMGAPVC